MTTPRDIDVVRALIVRYVEWLYASFPDQTEDLTAYYGTDRVQQALADVASVFVPPHGVALIARQDGAPAGCVMLHPIAPGIAEVKRLFVEPGARGNGLGHALLSRGMAEMAAQGHPVIRLDTALFLTDAIALYRKVGFVEIEPYLALPEGAVKTAVFMERSRSQADRAPS